MALQTPPRPGAPDDIDAGVIEDARQRQRRHRTIGLVMLLLAGLGLIVGFSAGGSGGEGGSGGGHRAGSGSPGPDGASLHSAKPGFAGAPVSQSSSIDGVSSWQCPVAPADRYLPPRSGCVTVMRADLTGDGRRDLVIVYSHLNHKRAAYGDGPPRWRHYFGASDATLEVDLPGGKKITARLTSTYGRRNYSIKVATIIALKHVSNQPGDEVFLAIGHISSGSTAAAYGLHNGHLIPAGALLAYGGDSGLQAGFNCQATTNPSKLIQRTFVFGARGTRARWQETQITYAWHGLKLVKVQEHTSGENGNPPTDDIEVGSGCGPVASTSRGATTDKKLIQ